MAIMRRPVSSRRSIKSRKATQAKRTFTAPRSKSYTPVNTRVGTNSQNFLVHRGIGFPDKYRTRLMYCESVTLGPFSPQTLYKAFTLSSPYDPDPAIGGGQPTWFDQLASIYRTCNVVGAKLTARYGIPNNTAVTNDGPYMIGLTTQAGASALTTTDAPTLATQPNTGHDLLVDGETKTLTCTYAPRMLNADMVNQSSTSGTATPFYGLVWASPQLAATGSINIIVTIEFICDFFDIKPVVDL